MRFLLALYFAACTLAPYNLAFADESERIDEYVRQKFEYEVLPHTRWQGAAWAALRENEQFWRILLSVNLDGESGLLVAASQLTRLAMRLDVATPNFYRSTLDLIQSPPLLGFIREFNAFSAVINEEAHRNPNRIFGSSLLQGANFLDGYLNTIKAALMNPEVVPEITSELMNDPDGFVTLYRGVKWHERYAQGSFWWREMGILSNVALTSILAEKDFDKAVRASRERLRQTGIRGAVFAHLFGPWKSDTTLISATLSENLARIYAGKNGYLIKIRVPRSRVHFLNDPIYWQGTPFERDGNPKVHINEVAVEHYVTPQEIISEEQVVTVPAESVSSHLARTALGMAKAYAWIFMLTANSYLEKCQGLVESLAKGSR